MTLSTSLSLLERLQTQPDESSWKRLVDLYHPLIRLWLRRAFVERAVRVCQGQGVPAVWHTLRRA